MINITRTEIQTFVKQHMPTKNMAIKTLHDFINQYNIIIANHNTLSSHALFQLLTIVLTREIQTNSEIGMTVEAFFHEIENKFGYHRMAFFRLCSKEGYLYKNVFHFILNLEKSEILPSTTDDLNRFLYENNLIKKPEEALTRLEENNSLSLYLSTQEIGRASLVNKGFRGLFRPALYREAAKQIAQAIVYANLKKAEQLIRAYPDLLIMPVTVNDYSNRQLYGTPLQLALGTKDVGLYTDERAMVEMIRDYLLSHFSDGNTIIAQQINEQFPAGWESAHQARIKRDQTALNTFVAAIIDSEEPADWEAAAVLYRKHFDNENKGRGIIKTGFHYNELALINFFNAYDDQYVTFGNDFSSPKNVFLWQKGSYCVRYVTACGAMILTRDLPMMLEKKMDLDRCLTFLYGGSFPCFGDSSMLYPKGNFFPLDNDSTRQLGFNCGVINRHGFLETNQQSGLGEPLSDYFEKKSYALQRFMQTFSSTFKTKQGPST